MNTELSKIKSNVKSNTFSIDNLQKTVIQQGKDFETLKSMFSKLQQEFHATTGLDGVNVDYEKDTLQDSDS